MKPLHDAVMDVVKKQRIVKDIERQLDEQDPEKHKKWHVLVFLKDGTHGKGTCEPDSKEEIEKKIKYTEELVGLHPDWDAYLYDPPLMFKNSDYSHSIPIPA